ncbi:MAG: DcaP family trimeric outer membrane transporter [Planctomycetota bacterium]
MTLVRFTEILLLILTGIIAARGAAELHAVEPTMRALLQEGTSTAESLRAERGTLPTAQTEGSGDRFDDGVLFVDVPGANGIDGFGNRNASETFRTTEFDRGSSASIGNDFNRFPEFEDGIIIVGQNAAMKIGGYVKADLISDFDAIDSTDSFDTTSIPVGAGPRQNARFHARQSRLSFDTRWRLGGEVARAFLEADFFGSASDGSDAFRLRHAYGRIGRLTAGQTWTTFTDPSAVPASLDTEGAVSNVNRRQGLVRLDFPFGWEGVSWAIALENPRINIEVPTGIQGVGRTETPDFVTRLRYELDAAEFQVAMVIRELGFQRVGEAVVTDAAYGFNLTGSAFLSERIKAYSQITFGEGIGSYRGSADVVATGANTAEILPMFGWMVGIQRAWSDRLSSNLTVSELTLDRIAGQDSGNLRSTTYVAVNLIQNPYERVFWGIEYLHGIRENQGGDSASANRIQMSFGFYLP